MTPSALAIVAVTYAGAQRATGAGDLGRGRPGGIAVGAVAGGMLTTWLDWRWIFSSTSRSALVAAVAARSRILRDDGAAAHAGDARPAGRADRVGGLATLVYAFSGAAEHGWGSARTLA